MVSCKWKGQFKDGKALVVLQSSARVDKKPPDEEEERAEDGIEADHPPGRQVPLHVGAIALEGDIEGGIEGGLKGGLEGKPLKKDFLCTWQNVSYALNLPQKYVWR